MARDELTDIKTFPRKCSGEVIADTPRYRPRSQSAHQEIASVSWSQARAPLRADLVSTNSPVRQTYVPKRAQSRRFVLAGPGDIKADLDTEPVRVDAEILTEGLFVDRERRLFDPVEMKHGITCLRREFAQHARLKARVVRPPLVVHLLHPAPTRGGKRVSSRVAHRPSCSSVSIVKPSRFGVSNAEMVIHAVVARSLVKSSNGAPLGTVGLQNFTRRTSPDERIPSIASQRSGADTDGFVRDDGDAFAVKPLSIDTFRC